MPYNFLVALYNGLISGDGHRKVQHNGNTTDYFSTHFIEATNQFQELCHKIGYSCIVKKHEYERTSLCDRKSYIYKCYVRKCDYGIVTSKEVIEYSGNVYDVTTDTGYFIVRRNGKVSVSGNCDLNPDYAPYGNWNWGFALVDVEKNGNFTVENHRILPSGAVV
jgi:hypothetical protein